jgi:hypothetical protein
MNMKLTPDAARLHSPAYYHTASDFTARQYI